MADLVFPNQPATLVNANAMPVNMDLEIYRGDYVQFYLLFQDLSGNPIDLTDFTIKAQIRAGYGAPALASFDAATTTTLGQAQITLSSAQSQTLTAGGYIWDIQLTNLAGNVRTYITGDVVVIDSVTT